MRGQTQTANNGIWFWTGAPCSPQRTWAENGFFQMLSFHDSRMLALGCALFAPRSKSAGRGCAHLFRPMYGGANMGHPSREEGFALSSNLRAAGTLRPV